MATFTKTRTPVKRFCHLTEVEVESGPALVLTINEIYPRGVKTDRYHLRPQPSDFGLAFTLEKLPGYGGDGTVYSVCLMGKDSLCGCRGFLQFGMACNGGKGCRHISSLQALVNAGKLPLPARAPAAAVA